MFMKIPGSYQDDMWMWDNYLCSWRSIQLHNLSETMNMAQRFKIRQIYWIVFSTFSDMFSPFLVVNTIFLKFYLLRHSELSLSLPVVSSLTSIFVSAAAVVVLVAVVLLLLFLLHLIVVVVVVVVVVVDVVVVVWVCLKIRGGDCCERQKNCLNEWHFFLQILLIQIWTGCTLSTYLYLSPNYVLLFTQLCAQNCHKTRKAGFYSEIIGHLVPCNSHAKSY